MDRKKAQSLKIYSSAMQPLFFAQPDVYVQIIIPNAMLPNEMKRKISHEYNIWDKN